MQFETVFSQRLTDPRNPAHFTVALGDLLVFRLVQVHSVASEVLGRVTGHVGPAHDLARMLGEVVNHDHSNADAHLENRLFPHEAELAHRITQLLGDLQPFAEGAVFEQQAELIPPQSGEGVDLPHLLVEDVGQLAQQLVAGQVTTGVVDDLELVQIQVQKAMLDVFLVRPPDRFANAVLGLSAVHQASEGIVSGLPIHLEAHFTGFADVVKHHHHTDNFTVSITNGRRGVFNGNLVAMAVHQHGVVGKANHFALLEHPIDRVRHRQAGVFIEDVHDVLERLASHLITPPARERLRHRIHEFNAAACIGGDDRIANGFEGHLHPLFFGGKQFLRAVARIGVHDVGHDVAQGAIGIVYPGCSQRPPNGLAICAQVALLKEHFFLRAIAQRRKGLQV